MMYSGDSGIFYRSFLLHKLPEFFATS
jgi:hypothetical protein